MPLRIRPSDVRDVIEAGARDWALPRGAVVAILALPFAIALTGPVAALMGKDAYKWLTEDDSLVENLQVLLFALAAVLAFLLAQRLRERSERLLAAMYAVVAIALVFLVGEEVSWGQRIFDWSTPESLDRINKQGETNVHNVYGVRMIFKWAYLVIGAYGTILPILVPRWGALAPYRDWLSWVVPHYTLIPCFVLLFPWRVYRNLFDPPESLYFVVSEYNEILELDLALGFFLFMWFHTRRTRPAS
jgi:hypothetical protein